MCVGPSLMSEDYPEILIDEKEWSSFYEEMATESERAMAVLAAAWIDSLLTRKLEILFSKGNSKTRQNLLNSDGPFASFSAKVNVTFCLGWIDVDVHHDLEVIRKIRNTFAHQIHGLSMDSPAIKELVKTFRIPHRKFHDWGQLKGAVADGGKGAVLYTDVAPEGSGDPLPIPTAFSYRWAVSLVVGTLSDLPKCWNS